MMGIESQYPFQLIEGWRNAFLATESGFGLEKYQLQTDYTGCQSGCQSQSPKDARDTRNIRNTFTFRINSLELQLQTDYTLTLHKLMAKHETQELMSIGTESQ